MNEHGDKYELEHMQTHSHNATTLAHSLTATDFAAHVHGAAIGYAFIYLNLNLNLSAAFTLPLLPNAIGYFILYRVLLVLAPMQRSLGLLQTPCVLLGAFSLTQVFPTLLPEESIWAGTLSLVFTLMSLYFHYQFLSDISALVLDYGATEEAEHLLFYRTALTVGTTALYCGSLLPRGWEEATAIITVLLLFVLVFTAICLIRLLFRAAKVIEESDK